MSNCEQDQTPPAPPPRAVLSQPVELLLEEQGSQTSVFDVIVVGSGYGGAVAAARLAGAKTKDGGKLKVVVLERGREYLPGDFPNRAALLPGHTRLSREGASGVAGVREGLFDLRLGRRVSALVANGLGGGSLINAGLMARPDPQVLDQLLGWCPAHGRAARDRLALELEQSFLRAEAMLGTETAPGHSHGCVPLAKRARLADLGQTTGRPLEPAAVTIAFNARAAAAGPVGFTQQLNACVHCGDCFSGCNIGAKKSLDTNYLALARARKARLFSGATVTHLQPLPHPESDGARWEVHLELTDEKLARSDRKPPPLRARWVILAAGTFGTFEILRRSEEAGWPLASSALGRHFSGNGDSICAVHDPDEVANSMADETVDLAKRNVGPTITGLVRAGARNGAAFVVQDLASPAPLQRLFEEVVTTQRMVMQIDRFDWSTHRAPSAGQDPLAIDPAVIHRTAVYAAMGDDGAAGQLKRSPQWRGDGGAFADWPLDHAPSRQLYDAQTAWFRAALRRRRATLIPNPLWQPLPEALTEFFGDVGRGLLTVHPLGGCRMSSQPAQGVVDFSGRVFKRDDPTVADDTPPHHEGLLVADGSVLPGAVGINPALTIAALAERSMARLMAEQGWTESTDAEQLKIESLQPPTAIPLGSTGIDLKERMVGRIRPSNSSGELTATITLAAEPIDDLMTFLQGTNGRIVKFSKAELQLSDGKHSGTAALKDAQLEVLVRGQSNVVGRLVSALKALWINRRHDLSRRPWYVLVLGFLLQLLHRPVASVRKLRFLLAFATHFGERRHLIYRFPLPAGVTVNAKEVLKKDTVLVGVKTIEYAVDGNPWEQLMQLSLHEGSQSQQGPVIGTLNVDLGYFAQVQQPLVSVTAQRDQPSALMDLLSFGLFVGRLLAKIHFWSFRLPDDYPDPVVDDNALRRRRLPQPGLGEKSFEQQVCRFEDGSPRLTLSRYVPRQAKIDQPPIVLIHGFSASGSTFAHPAIPRNMVQALMNEGRQVWVADLRTSIGHRGAARKAVAFDEVARKDVTDAISAAFEANGQQPVDVFAHCVGAAMFCQAVMQGLLLHGETPMVNAAFLSQTSPIVRMRPQNQLRAFLALYLRHFLGTETLDPLGSDFAGLQGNLIDRLLATFPYPRSERARMSGRHGPAPYAKYRARTDAVFGQLFNLDNLHESVLAALPDLLGEVNLDSYAQIIHWVRRGLLTDMLGQEALARVSAIDKHFSFPVQFLHGADNQVFAVTGAQLCAHLLPEGKAQVFLIEGYGHQDVVLSRPDADRCGASKAPMLITGHSAIELTVDKPAPESGGPATFSRKPAVGPVLGWLRTEQQDRFKLRVLVGEKLYAPTRRFEFSGAKAEEVIESGEQESSRSGVSVYDLELHDARNSAGVSVGNLVLLPDGSGVPLTGPLMLQWLDRGSITLDRRPAAPAMSAAPSTLILPKRDIIRPSGGWLTPEVDFFPPASPATAPAPSAAADEPEQAASGTATDPGARNDKTAEIALPDHLRAAADQGRPLACGELAPLTFALASCSYPPQIFDRGLAQRSMEALLNRLDREPKPQFLLLLGDQVYADATANVADPRLPSVRYEEATERWMDLKQVQKVFKRLPVYMMLDDHEIDDQYEPGMWPPGSPRASFLKEALQSFHRWQGALGPDSGRRDPTQADYNPHFDFYPGGYPFFVLNTRTRRDPRSYRTSGHLKVPGEAGIVDDEQMAALMRFLSNAQTTAPGAPKFIASPSVVFPDVGMRSQRSRLRSDGWSGFGRSARCLVSFIEKKQIENVVFLCGDYHASAAASATTKENAARLLSIVSSGLYAPYPFANAQTRDFVSGSWPLESTPPLATVELQHCTHRDGFAVVHVEPRRAHTGRLGLHVDFHGGADCPQRVRLI